MRVLAIDTSSELCGVAIVDDDAVLAAISARLGARQGEMLFAVLDQAFSLAGIDRGAIDAIAVGLGPGSFTGTRVGVATAKGLALALDRPLVGVSSTLAIALAAPGDSIATIVDAHKGEVYAALYRRERARMRAQLEPFNARPDEVRARFAEVDCLAVGTGVRRHAIDLPSASAIFDRPSATAIAAEAIARVREGTIDDRATLEPLYVRGADAKLPSGA